MSQVTDNDYAVLFVDDEEKALKYFRLAFAKDFPVLTAASVAQALEVLEAQGERIGVLITDQRMPGQPGVELLKRARAQWPGIVRILTTAYSDLEDAIAAVNRGEILRYVNKPWDIQSLGQELRHAMDFFLLRRERDLLLEAKLSVRQGMLQAERLRGLIASAAGLEHLRAAPAAAVAWSLDAARAPQAPSAPSLELWETDVAETLRLTRLSRRMRVLDRATGDGYPDRLSLPRLLADAGVSVLGSAPEVAGRGELLQTLCADLARAAGSPATAHLAESRLASGVACASALMTGPGQGGQDPEALLPAYLLAWHHGGTLSTAWEADGLRMELGLAVDPGPIEAPEPDADWLTEQFARLEDWGG